MQAHWENHLLDLAGYHPPRLSHKNGAWITNGSVKNDVIECANIAKAHSKSFFLATSFLPAEKRDAVRVLYAFCRTVDDIVDEGEIENREQQLDEWRAIVSGSRHTNYSQPIARAWRLVMDHYQIPARYALQLIDGVARDLTQNRYQTFEDLSTYCYGVASTVGLMSMYIIGFRSHAALRYAINLGVALQLTNILRDVGEDMANGRIYLPLSELHDFGVTLEQLENGKINARFVDLIKFNILRVRNIYAEAERGITFLDPSGRLAVSAASIFYKGILDVIERNNYDVFNHRASLSFWEKLSRVPRLILKSQSA